MNILQSYISANGFLQYNSNFKEIKNIDIKPYFNKGLCMIKNKNGFCNMKKTYIIKNIKKCVCEYHLNSNANKLINLIDFYEKINIYIKNIYIYKDDKYNFIKNLKDILLLVIKYKKYKYTLKEYFYLVYININNFDIQDDEYLDLLNYFKSIY
jgi:hypothetical protein